MEPEDLGTNPGDTLYCFTKDTSVNLSCFPLPIRESETNNYIVARGFGEILTSDTLSTVTCSTGQ